MVIRERQVDREIITGAIIFICIFVIILSIVSIRFLDVKVSNIELVDRGLYTVITDNGPINVRQDDVLRIERTFPKAAITGAVIEQDRIYTTKGFIFITDLDPFYKTGRKLIDSLDFEGKPVWIKSNKSQATESLQSWNQELDANLKAVQPYSYAIGTPDKLTPIVFAVLALQYFALAIGGMALVILIFPFRLVAQRPVQALRQEDQEHSSPEEVMGVVVK